MSEGPIPSVGLGGDGDEVAAIDELERAFGVTLDKADAPTWVTAGDVFRSLQKALSADELTSPYLWKRFVVALCSQTGADHTAITPESPLLSPSRLWVHVADGLTAFWILMSAIAIGLVAWALL